VIARVAVVAAAALVLAGPAAAACAHPRTSLAFLEGQVMCPTCHTTLDQSNSPAAQRIEVYIKRRIAECASARQIKSELVAQFGQGILAAPPHKGFDLLAWWVPLAGVIGGALLLAVGVWRWNRARGPDVAEELDPETEQRLDELLARFE
jgi:cytochrome c-type biogenesis protein CcmH